MLKFFDSEMLGDMKAALFQSRSASALSTLKNENSRYVWSSSPGPTRLLVFLDFRFFKGNVNPEP